MFIPLTFWNFAHLKIVGLYGTVPEINLSSSIKCIIYVSSLDIIWKNMVNEILKQVFDRCYQLKQKFYYSQ